MMRGRPKRRGRREVRDGGRPARGVEGGGAADEGAATGNCACQGALGPVTRNTEVQDLWWQEIHWVFAFSPSASGGELYFVLLFNDKYNGLYPKHMRALSELTKLSMSEIYEVASFYAHFHILNSHFSLEISFSFQPIVKIFFVFPAKATE